MDSGAPNCTTAGRNTCLTVETFAATSIGDWVSADLGRDCCNVRNTGPGSGTVGSSTAGPMFSWGFRSLLYPPQKLVSEVVVSLLSLRHPALGLLELLP